MQKYFHEQSSSYIDLGRPFSLGDISYPDNWLALASDEEIAAIGLVPVVTVGEALDRRLYKVTERLEGAVLTIVSEPLPIELVKADALAAIDAAAGQARARYITIVPGQEATYLLKAQQAAAFKAGGYAGPVPGLVRAEIDATGATPQQATDAILAQQAAWETIAAAIESARRCGKVAVGAAAGVAAVDAARQAAEDELGAL